MPLEPTKTPDHGPETDRPLTRRRLLLGGAALLAAGALTACADSTARDAQRGKEKDTSRESVVKEMQATETWRVVNATPTPDPSTPDD